MGHNLRRPLFPVKQKMFFLIWLKNWKHGGCWLDDQKVYSQSLCGKKCTISQRIFFSRHWQFTPKRIMCVHLFLR